MRDEQDLAATATAIIDANLYMVLGTADERGRPWPTPVYYAVANYREFYWVSRPEAIHSRNIKTRPEIGIVIFDSSAPIGTGQGVYMNAVAEELQAAEHVVAINIFSRRSLEQGGVAWTVDDVRPPSELRLYRATALAHFVLGSHDERLQVRL